MDIYKTKQQITNLNERFFFNLENFVPHYISYLQNPKSIVPHEEIQHVNSVNNEINSQGFIINNDIDVEIYKNKSVYNKISIEIEKLQEDNNLLKNKNKQLNKSRLTSEGLFDNEIEWYRKQVKTIIVIVIGIILLVLAYRSLKLNNIVQITISTIFLRMYGLIINSVKSII